MNHFFRFKEFTVNQENCAMKVCTDSCLFGAWVAEKIKTCMPAAQTILDIGGGTGLLSLMLAQKIMAHIDAVEIDRDAFITCTQNVENAGKSGQIKCFRTAIQDFVATKKYDVIICNPPFYERSLPSPAREKNVAMHAAQLSFDELIRSVTKLLSPSGTAFFLLSKNSLSRFSGILENGGLYTRDRIFVSHSAEHVISRMMISVMTTPNDMNDETLNIREKEGGYSARFKDLLKDYYLHGRL